MLAHVEQHVAESAPHLSGCPQRAEVKAVRKHFAAPQEPPIERARDARGKTGGLTR
jgi:hypothetical protein